jgi:hypothetical protein
MTRTNPLPGPLPKGEGEAAEIENASDWLNEKGQERTLP